MPQENPIGDVVGAVAKATDPRAPVGTLLYYYHSSLRTTQYKYFYLEFWDEKLLGAKFDRRAVSV